MTRPTFTEAMYSRTDGRPSRPLFPEAEGRASHLSTGSTTPVASVASSPLAAVSDTDRARRALPNIPRPVTNTPKADEPTRPVALPVVKPQVAVPAPEPVKAAALPAVEPSAAITKPEKPKPIKRRNRSRVLTEVDLVILNYLSIVRIAKAEHIMDLIKEYKNADVRTGEIKSPSLRTVSLRMERLRNFKGKGNGYVDYNKEIAGHTIWFLSPKGEHLIKTGTRSVIPSNPMWNHYLALAAVAARDLRRGFTLIGDDAINRAVRAHREIKKQEYVPMSDLKDNPEYKMPEVGKLVPHYFAIPLGTGKAHRPDLIVLREGIEPIAVEMELNYKSPESIQANLAGHIRAVNEGRIGQVIYYCGEPKIETFVRNQLAKIVNDPSTVEDKILFETVDLKALHADIPKIGGY